MINTDEYVPSYNVKLTINGNIYNGYSLGMPIAGEQGTAENEVNIDGVYVLTVGDYAGNESTVTFTVDTTPIVQNSNPPYTACFTTAFKDLFYGFQKGRYCNNT